MYRDLNENFFRNKYALHLAELWSITGDFLVKSTFQDEFYAFINSPSKKIPGVIEFILWKYIA